MEAFQLQTGKGQNLFSLGWPEKTEGKITERNQQGEAGKKAESPAAAAAAPEDSDISRFIKYSPEINLSRLVNFYISMSLRRFQSKRKAAEALGVSVRTIYNKIQSGEVADL